MSTHSTDGLSLPKRVILVGVGGASCSGKTTLAKHLRSIIKGSFIIHQDDFAPPEELVPFHPTLGIQDWDDPEGAVQWPRMAEFLRRVRREQLLPNDYKSHDALNPQVEVPIPKEVVNRWSETFSRVEEEAKRGEHPVEIVWGIVDGFLLYWHPDVVRELDVRLFLREAYGTLKARRESRFGYSTAALDSPEGSLWEDPPNYWDDIVWPAYLKAHHDIFIEGDVSRGEPIRVDDKGEASGNRASQEDGLVVPTSDAVYDSTYSDEILQRCGGPVPRLIVFPAEGVSMTKLVEDACRRLVSYVSNELNIDVDTTHDLVHAP